MRLRIGGFRTPFRTARMCMCTASGAVAHDFTLSETRAIEIFRAWCGVLGKRSQYEALPERKYVPIWVFCAHITASTSSSDSVGATAAAASPWETGVRRTTRDGASDRLLRANASNAFQARRQAIIRSTCLESTSRTSAARLAAEQLIPPSVPLEFARRQVSQQLTAQELQLARADLRKRLGGALPDVNVSVQFTWSESIHYIPVFVFSHPQGSPDAYVCLVHGITGELSGTRVRSLPRVLAAVSLPTLSLGILAQTLSAASTDATAVGTGAVAALCVAACAQRAPLLLDRALDWSRRNMPLQWRKMNMRVAESGVAHSDHYALLGVCRSATTDEIKAAFRALAHEYHPDVYTGTDKAENARVFRQIVEAHRVLSNDAQRRAYDEELRT